MSAAADVILISWNGLTDTVRALESLRSQTSALRAAGHDLQITVVDNGSSDNTERVIRSSFPKVRLLRLEENRGFTGGIAHAARSSEADALIFLNNDAVVEPGWLGEMLDILLTAPDDVIAASGRMVDPTGTLADFVRGVMTFDGHGFQPGFRQPLEKVDEPPDGSEILFPCGGNMIVKRKAFLDLGGFDEDYFAYLEDVDFGWRAWLSGWRVLYTSRAVVRHRSSATSERLGHFERGVLFEKNAMQTFLKNIDDDLLGSFSGPFFLTLLHRMHRYVVDRNEKTERFRRPPLGEQGHQPEATGWTSRARRSLVRRSGREGTRLHDPLTEMQFRATEWLFTHADRILEKRSRVQQFRKRTDREIFEKFPLYYVPTYPGDERLMSSPLFRLLMPDVPSIERTLDEILRK